MNIHDTAAMSNAQIAALTDKQIAALLEDAASEIRQVRMLAGALEDERDRRDAQREAA